jgi:hypothetical protein
MRGDKLLHLEAGALVRSLQTYLHHNHNGRELQQHPLPATFFGEGSEQSRDTAA